MSMTFEDLNRLPRMKDTLKASDLNTDGCLDLATAILKGAAEDLEQAARLAAARPTKENLQHLETRRNFYQTEMFAKLSLGLVNGKEVAQNIIRNALRGRKVRG